MTLDPASIADVVVERAVAWVPAPCWALVSSDLSGQLSILAERGVEPDTRPSLDAVAGRVMQGGDEFDVGRPARAIRACRATSSAA